MANGLVFVLHDEADKAYAEQLAGALAPVVAFPAPLHAGDDQITRYGSGATCIIVWSDQMRRQDVAERAFAALSTMKGNAAICCVEASPPFETPVASQIDVVQACGDHTAVGAELRGVIARLRQRLSERGAQRGRAAPRLAHTGGMATATIQPRSKPDIAVRSAYGLAATLAVVGVIAPTVGYRAGAASLPPSAGHEGSADASADMGAAGAPDDVGEAPEAAPTSLRETTPAALVSSSAAYSPARETPASPPPAEATELTAARDASLALPAGPPDDPTQRLDASALSNDSTPPFGEGVGADIPALVLDVGSKPMTRSVPADGISGLTMMAPMAPLKPPEWEYRAYSPPAEAPVESIPETAESSDPADSEKALLTSGDD